MTALVVRACGPMTTLQDSGRIGWQRYGVSNSGAMDRLALAAANALVGNPPGAAAIEFILLGGSFGVEGGSARVALAGAPFALTQEGERIPSHASLTLRPGEALTVAPPPTGVYAVLAVAGGFDLPEALGSLSLHPRAGLGGFKGRPLRPGDRLPLHLPQAPEALELGLSPLALDPEAEIRVVLGPQADHFSDAAIAGFLAATYRVSQEADRMGYRLNGPAIAHARGFNIVSDGIATGAVQVPGSGQPIVLMADRQTAGGYPKIATVISADLRVLAQRQPGDPVRFAVVDMRTAQASARERAALVAELRPRLAPVSRPTLSAEDLLGLNLAGAAVNALRDA